MRLILGMILGAMLTVGGVYISDNMTGASAPGASVQRPMVNWDVVSENWRHLTDRVRDHWNNLSATENR